MQELEEVMKSFRDEMGAVFIGMGVVGPDGFPVSDIVFSPTFNAKEGETRGTMAMLMGKKVSQKLGLGQMEELMMTSNMGYFMSVDLGNTYTLMLGVAKQATLGALRMLIKEYAPRLVKACPK